ncbi:putative AbiEii toxin of type IV toxin-antitoxin system [Nocardioides aurantiacus]|uniref:Putative AbiEii toxin of type IV toxin-antitoxin system n=2 Tax=Nocardioides aurantiacus TaxID=86796 RepID=A0A3N2CW93_9ACTN|nr:putative AbiEii toxin of type IV toxin-antitoxin system [Nocardioides aurantiacus]
MFEGYKRLADTSCNVSPYLLAFVGQNESGKSSVLTGLEWLSEDDETPLSSLDKSRVKRKDAGWIVGAEFVLGDDELEILEPLGFDHTPTGVSLFKQANGSLTMVFDNPRRPKRDPAPFLEAAEGLRRARERLAKQISATDAQYSDEKRQDGPTTWIDRIAERLDAPDSEWDSDDQAATEALHDWLAETPAGRKNPRDSKAASLIRSAAMIGSREHPNDVGIDLLRERVPAFLLFREDDRILPTVTPVDRQSRSHMPSAVANLLAVAGVDITAVWRAHSDQDSGEKKTLLDLGNRRLDSFFGQAWNQSNISVNIDVDETGLRTHVVDMDTRRFTRIEERSEGLRAFVTLALFLGSQALEIPPILLIDEAELHLHSDAQADLVGGLLKQINATQVWYTTHSPACLPSDLGTGIRLLERHDEKSEIKTHFWTNNEPGFGPLLYAMGAGAAAFSRCRRAVLGEGASEMILLPTLIRAATGLDDLAYQVAPGLSHAQGHGFDVEEVAARVIYLTDGDKAGSAYLTVLRARDVPEARLKSLPRGTSIEDLLDRDFLLEVIDAVLPLGAPRPTARAFKASQTAGRSITQWSKANHVALGKVAIAYEVVGRAPDIRLAPGAPETLQALHAEFMDAFEAGERTS